MFAAPEFIADDTLEGLAKQLKTLGLDQAYEQVMQAVSDFEKGNLRLSTVLASMQEPKEL